MASIHKERDCKNWIASFYGPDGRRCRKSTGTPDRATAMRIALEYEGASKDGRQGRLTESRVRAVLADIFRRANNESLPTSTAREFFSSWLKVKALEVSPASYAAYEQTTRLLADHLKAKADRPIDAVTLKDATAWRAGLAKRVSPTTTNKLMKIARVIWGDAVRNSLTTDNPFAKVPILKTDGKQSRRAFTLEEIKLLLENAGMEWRGMILCGLYTGQRLGDIAGLTWQNVDLEHGRVSFVTAKTGRQMHIPLAEPLKAYLLSLPSSDDPTAPIFPDLHGRDTSTLSNGFNAIAAAVGLARAADDHQAHGEGRESRRTSRGLSFHCLRHTATSLLKNAGVSDVLAREIIGHESEAVSRVYTHIEHSAMRTAIDQLPDVTKTKKEKVKA